MTDKNATGKKIDFEKLYGDENQGGASTFPNVFIQISNYFLLEIRAKVEYFPYAKIIWNTIVCLS